MAGIISERAYRVFRAHMKAGWQAVNAPCALCGQADIDWDGPPSAPKSFELDHRKARKPHPELALEPTNAQPSHSLCNRNKSYGDMRPGIGQTSEDF